MGVGPLGRRGQRQKKRLSRVGSTEAIVQKLEQLAQPNLYLELLGASIFWRKIDLLICLLTFK
jgi:hypothetical protein